MQNIPSVPSIKPPELPSDMGDGMLSNLATLREILYSWWFWVAFLSFLAIISWIIISRRNRREGW